MQKKTLLQYIGISLRGMGMGAADVVPGVSGGTIAFITGIYEELINSLTNINGKAFKKLTSEGIGSFWKHINGNFFLALFIGIAISVFSLAKLVSFLLEDYPVLLWSFFFGLVLASAWLVLRTITKWNGSSIIGLLIGIVVAGFISLLQTTSDGASLGYVFISGAIAICAMILPGISGAFILVLLGSYNVIIDGIKELNLSVVAVFGAGCVIGLLAFSRLLKYLFTHFKNFVLALLSGFLIGSLIKIWPWKNRVGDEPIVVHSDGKEDYMMTNVFPSDFICESKIDEIICGAQLGGALVMFLLGLTIILVMGIIAPKKGEV